MRPERIITVCSECLRASCWQQPACRCDEFAGADIARVAESLLRDLNLESSNYWLTDQQIAAGPATPRRVLFNHHGLSDAAVRTLVDNLRCPECVRELADGWRCQHCGYDVSPLALALL